jgi:hypothetical protein
MCPAGCAAESGSNIGVVGICRDRPLWLDDAARRVIQTLKPEPGIMRCELTDCEWSAIKMRPVRIIDTSSTEPASAQATDLAD